MAEISAATVRELRDKTGAGMMDCKTALSETGGDLEKAIDYLRTKGLAKAAKKSGRATREGVVYSYIHPGGRVGVLVEINCESDFVARTEDFNELCKDVAMQIAATSPNAVQRTDIDPKLLDREREIFQAQAAESGKPANIIAKMVEGRIEKLYKEVALMEQEFVKDPGLTVADRVNASIAKLGENIQVRRFVRYQVGEEN
jgi:elongation factor Ts